MKKDINTREDAVTKDMEPAKKGSSDYHFPSLGVTVKADSYQEALKKAKGVIKSKK